MKALTLILFFALTYGTGFAQVFRIDSLSADGVLLDKGWKWHAGDNPDWAKSEFDDSAWKPIDPTKDIAALPEVFNAQIKWLRLDFEVKNKLPNPLGIAINQAGASEIYLNGRLIHQFGHFDTDSTKVKAYDPLEIPIYFPADSVGQYQLAVRYALQPTIRYTNLHNLTKNRLLNATLLNLVPTLNAQRDFRVYYTGIDLFKMAVLFMLFVLHLAFYFYQRSQKTHLLIAIGFLAFSFIYIFKIIGENQFSVEYRYFNLNISMCSYFIGACILVSAFYRMAKMRLDNYYYAFVVLQLVSMFVSGFTYGGIPWLPILFLIGSIFSFMIMFRLTRIGLKKKIKGFWILGVTIMIAFLANVCVVTSVLFLNYSISVITGYKIFNYAISPYLFDVVFNLGAISTPIGLSLFMGIEGNEINKALSKQLVENDQLKNEAIEHEQEKQQILATQNETLEKQVAERTAELKASQNQLIQKEKLASLGELTAGIAHEIQNPLNFVNNFSELSVELIEELKSPLIEASNRPGGGMIDIKSIDMELFDDVVENLEKINFHGKRASSIVKGMLEHSKTSTGERVLTDINALCDEYLHLAYHGMRAKNKDFNSDYKTDFDPYLPKTNVIPQDIGRVLLNLYNNAFYAVHQGAQSPPAPNYTPSVEVSTRYTPPFGGQRGIVTISVKDNGNGIPDNIKSKIFQPFFTTKPTGEGTGLGLSLAYDIVNAYGGSLSVQSDTHGSNFIFTLLKT